MSRKTSDAPESRAAAPEPSSSSQQRLAAVFEAAPVGLAALGPPARFQHVNDALAELLGRSVADLLALELTDVVDAADLRAVRAACEEVRASGAAVGLTTRYRLPDGAVLPMTSRLARLVDASGQALLALVVVGNPQADASRPADDTAESLRWLLENVRDYAIFLLDPAGRIETWGAGARQVFGYDEQAVVGRPIDVIFTPEDRASGAVAWELTTAREQGQVPEERWHVREDGQRFWGSGVMTALHDSNGGLRGYAKICRDLTAQKRSDEQRDELLTRETSAREAAEQAAKAKDALLATVSHELRTPLSAMVLWAKMLEDGQGNERQRATALAAIVRGGEAQRQLIEDLLDLSRMVAGTLRIELKEVDLTAVVRSAVDTVQAMALSKQIQLSAELGRTDTILVHGDAARLQQIVWNLLSNAVKFTPRGGQVELRLERLPRKARVTVRDTGRGIAADFLPYVFDRFRQGDGKTAAGLGLGLSIVRELVALHSGWIEAASDGEALGATFTMELPRLSRASSILPPPPAAELRDASERPLEGLRVLLVEDNIETQYALVWLLEDAGADVAATASAGAALTSLSERWPDVLVSDIGLPGSDGYELMMRVREHAADRGLLVPPALALTAFARSEDKERALSAGFLAYASKPIDPQPLVDAVSALAQAAR